MKGGRPTEREHTAGLARGGVLIIVLSVVVAGLLLEGAIRRFRAQPADPLPSRPISFGLVQPVLEKTPLAYEADYWTQLAGQVRPRLVMIAETGQVGVMIEPGEVLSPLSPHQSVVSPVTDSGSRDGTGTDGQPVAVDLDTGIALWQLDGVGPASAFPWSDPQFWQAATRVAAITIGPDGRAVVAPGYLAGRQDDRAAGSLEASVPWSAAPRFAALVDIEGRLIGIGELREGRQRWSGQDRVHALLARLRTAEPCRPVQVRDLTDEDATAEPRPRGVVIERVWPQGLSASVPLARGDVLTDWGARRIESAEEFTAAYDATAPGRAVRVRVSRGPRRIVSTVEKPDRFCRPVVDHGLHLESLGITLMFDAGDQSGEGPCWRVARIEEREGAGPLRAGDRILSVDGFAAGTTDAERRLARLAGGARGPVLLTVARDGATVLLRVGGR